MRHKRWARITYVAGIAITMLIVFDGLHGALFALFTLGDIRDGRGAMLF